MIKNTRESPNNKREQHSPARPSLLAEPLSRVDDTTTKTKLHIVEEIGHYDEQLNLEKMYNGNQGQS